MIAINKSLMIGGKICRCSKCGLYLPESVKYFRKGHKKNGLDSWCKKCNNTMARVYFNKNRRKKIHRIKKERIIKICIQCKKEFNSYKNLQKYCSKECYSVVQIKYHTSGLYKKYNVKYHTKRLKSDPMYKLQKSLGRELRITLKTYNIKKEHRSMQYRGCTLGFLVNHLFSNDVSLDNYLKGGYEIEHIIPKCLWELDKFPDDIYQAEHWSNLQILDEETHSEKTKRDMELLAEIRGDLC